MEKDKNTEADIAKPIPNEDAWGMADHEMPSAPTSAEQQMINEAIGEKTIAVPTEHIPDISQGSDIEIG